MKKTKVPSPTWWNRPPLLPFPLYLLRKPKLLSSLAVQRAPLTDDQTKKLGHRGEAPRAQSRVAQAADPRWQQGQDRVLWSSGFGLHCSVQQLHLGYVMEHCKLVRWNGNESLSPLSLSSVSLCPLPLPHFNTNQTRPK